MGRVIAPSSEEGKELQKWEQFPAHWQGEVIPAGNPYVYRPYPAMLYKAYKRENGKVMCMDTPVNPYLFQTQAEYDRALMLSEQFNKSCQRIVHNEAEALVAKGQGWCATPTEALAAFEAMEQAIGNAAAEAAAAARGLSEKARAELKAADESTHQHVTDVVGPKRGRPKAVVAVEE